MKNPPVGLLAAIHAESISPRSWVAWADREIAKYDQPPMWVIDLALANDFRDAGKAIRESIEESAELPSRELDEAVLGLIALKYFDGEIDFRQFLLRAGDHTDPSGCSLDCEFFYHHLQRFESAEDPSEYETQAGLEIRQDLKEAIAFGEYANRQIRSILGQ